MTEKRGVHTDRYRVHSYEADMLGRARPTVLYAYLMNSAWKHVMDTPFSFDSLEEQGMFWVLARFRARFDGFPEWDDEVSVDTWGTGLDRLFAMRDFLLSGNGGEVLVRAVSSWLILDKKTYRPRRPDKLADYYHFDSEKRALDVSLDKLPPLSSEERDTGFRTTAVFSDIDVNGHVNAARYMRWILDSCPSAVRRDHMLEFFEINYLLEAQLGDKVVVYSDPGGEGKDLLSVRRVEDGRELCRARVLWRGVSSG